MLSPRSIDNRSRTFSVGGALALCLLASVLAYFFAGSLIAGKISEVVFAIAAPLWKMRDMTVEGVDIAFLHATSKHELVLENNALKAALTESRREASRAARLSIENEDLRLLVGRLPEDARAIVAGVIHGSEYAPYDMGIVDAGEIAGVRERMVVVAPEGCALGIVSRTYPHHSVIMYFTAGGINTDAVVESASGTIPIVLRGRGAGTMQFDITRESEPVIGDRVVLPGFSRHEIGVVAHIDGAEENVLRTVYVRPTVSSVSQDHLWIDTTSVWSPSVERGEGVFDVASTSHDTYVR